MTFKDFQPYPETILPGRKRDHLHGGNPRAGYLLVGSLPPLPPSTELKNSGIRRGLLQDAHGKHLPELSGIPGREDFRAGMTKLHLRLMDLALAGMRKLKRRKLQDRRNPMKSTPAPSSCPWRWYYGDGPVIEEWLVFF